MNSPTSLSFLLIWNWNDTKYVHTLHSSLENHTRFQIKMGKVYTLPDGAAYTCMSYIRKSPPPPPAENSVIERLSFPFTSNGNANLYHVTELLVYLSFTAHYFYTLISSFTQLFIHKNCLSNFYLLIFNVEKFSTWIWRLPYTWSLTLS